MLRFSVLAFVLGTASAIGACYSAGDDDGGESGGASSGGSAGITSGGKGGQTARGGATGDPPLGGADSGGGSDSGGSDSGGTSGSGGSSGSSGSGGTTTSCVTETRELEDLIMAGAGGQTDITICDFNVPADVDDNFMNVFIGGTQLCWLASSQGCDMNPYGFWLNSGQILLCDVACSAYFDPDPDVPVTIELGCEIDSDCL